MRFWLLSVLFASNSLPQRIYECFKVVLLSLRTFKFRYSANIVNPTIFFVQWCLNCVNDDDFFVHIDWISLVISKSFRTLLSSRQPQTIESGKKPDVHVLWFYSTLPSSSASIVEAFSFIFIDSEVNRFRWLY